MAEPLEQENEDPWAAGPESPEPWCDTCEGGHDDHAKFLAERAAAVAGWSASAEALEEALGRSCYVVRTMRSEAADEAAGLYTQIGRLVRELRQVADAAAWRAQREAAEAAAAQAPEVAECGYCAARITLLGGDWTADDGTTACTDTSAPYVPHRPKEAGRD